MEYVNKKLNQFNRELANKKVAIIGVGVSNAPLLEYLYNNQAKVTIFDRKTIDQLDKNVVELIEKYNIECSLGENYISELKGFDIIFRSPSCRTDLPELVAEKERGALVTSEIEMLLKLCPGKVIGITGSDGKTTTTSLTYAIIKERGYDCYLGGNIGVPLFTKLSEMTPDSVVVLELSSFQLMDMDISPDISVITNISPNHLDIHKSYEEYINCKKNIYKYQSENGIVVLNADNDITNKLDSEVNGKAIMFSSKQNLDDGVIYQDGAIYVCKNGEKKSIINTTDVKLRGIHNYENICAAIAATSSLVDTETQVKAICNFSGVEHRLEFIREIDGVKWYNDSIGTSPTRTIAGLNAFDEKIVLIAGGYDKHLDYTPIALPIVENVSALILMGATADKIEKAVSDELNNQGKEMPIIRCTTLEETINAARSVAKPGEVVLFSPASASFDMFKNFAERGNIFKDLVNKI